MPRARSPKRDEAYQLWLDSEGKKKLKDIAAELGVSESQIRKWKNQDKWKGNVTNQVKGNVTKKAAVAEEVERVIKNPNLTDKQRLFCLYYVRCFNATRAYQKAYGVDYSTAASIGYRLLEKDGVREEIQKLKQSRLNREMLEEHDIFQKYMDIAFADITDYVEFGREEIQVMGAFGPVEIKDPETGESVSLKRTVNTVRFKESDEVDGTLIAEVKQGKDGASVKLMDRMKALNWLAEHMDLATEQQKAYTEQMRARTEQIRGTDQDPAEDKIRKLFEAIGGVLDESE